ncbi:MAG: hypothetical protein ACM3O6_17710 [Acidobacteriota bacterium]
MSNSLQELRMSFDIFIFTYRNGEGHYYPRALLENAFDGLVDRSDRTWWKLIDHGARISVPDDPKISGFSVNRPPTKDHPFWPAPIDVLRKTPSVLFWPGKGGVVAHECVIGHSPSDLVAAIGLPTVTTDIEVIFDLIREA